MLADEQSEDDFGLGVAQIVITAATPMEEVEHPFPGLEETADDTVKSTESSEGDLPSSTTTDMNESESKEPTVIMDEKEEQETTEAMEDMEEKSTVDDLPADSAPFPVSSSSGSEADSMSGPSTGENSQSIPSRGTVVDVQEETEDAEETEDIEIIPEKMVVGGRASIPDELQPDQLEKLQNLKESNA